MSRTLATVVVACRATVPQEGELGHVVLPVAARPELEAAEALVTAHEVLGGHGIPDDVAGDGAAPRRPRRRRRAR